MDKIKRYRHWIFCSLLVLTLFLGYQYNGALATIGGYNEYSTIVSVICVAIWASCCIGWIILSENKIFTATVISFVIAGLLIFIILPIEPSPAMLLKVLLLAPSVGLGKYLNLGYIFEIPLFLLAVVWLTYFISRKDN